MNRNIYIRDEDEAVWERARELSGARGVSTIVVQGLKRFIAEKEAKELQAKGFERIVVNFNDADAHHIPRIKAFYGRWISPPSNPEIASSENDDKHWRCAVALTAKGAAVFHLIEEEREDRAEWFKVFPSLEAAAADSDVNWVARRAILKLGVPVEELDI